MREALDEVFGLGGKGSQLRPGDPLHAMLPELDSMAATSVIAVLEDRLGCTIEPGDITGEDFDSLASLVAAFERLRVR